MNRRNRSVTMLHFSLPLNCVFCFYFLRWKWSRKKRQPCLVFLLLTSKYDNLEVLIWAFFFLVMGLLQSKHFHKPSTMLSTATLKTRCVELVSRTVWSWKCPVILSLRAKELWPNSIIRLSHDREPSQPIYLAAPQQCRLIYRFPPFYRELTAPRQAESIQKARILIELQKYDEAVSIVGKSKCWSINTVNWEISPDDGVIFNSELI